MYALPYRCMYNRKHETPPQWTATSSNITTLIIVTLRTSSLYICKPPLSCITWHFVFTAFCTYSIYTRGSTSIHLKQQFWSPPSPPVRVCVRVLLRAVLWSLHAVTRRELRQDAVLYYRAVCLVLRWWRYSIIPHNTFVYICLLYSYMCTLLPLLVYYSIYCSTHTRLQLLLLLLPLLYFTPGPVCAIYCTPQFPSSFFLSVVLLFLLFFPYFLHQIQFFLLLLFSNVSHSLPLCVCGCLRFCWGLHRARCWNIMFCFCIY